MAVLPDVPDISKPVDNPYRVDRHGASHLAKDETPREASRRKQDLARIASAKFKNFLVFHPIAQIIVIGTMGRAQFGSFGSVRQPISSLSSFDGSKMALLVDPRTGEMIFKGGRYDLSDQIQMV